MSEQPRSLANISAYELARDYQIYKSIDFKHLPLLPERLFGAKEASILHSIAEHPEAARLMDDYRSGLPENQNMPRVSEDPGTGLLSLAEFQRQVQTDFIHRPSLISHNFVAGFFGYMAERAGWDRDSVIKATEMGGTFYDIASGIAAGATAGQGAHPPGDPYDRLYSPHQKWVPPPDLTHSKGPLGELGIPGLGPNSIEERTSRPVSDPDNEIQHGVGRTIPTPDHGSDHALTPIQQDFEGGHGGTSGHSDLPGLSGPQQGSELGGGEGASGHSDVVGLSGSNAPADATEAATRDLSTDDIAGGHVYDSDVDFDDMVADS